MLKKLLVLVLVLTLVVPITGAFAADSITFPASECTVNGTLTGGAWNGAEGGYNLVWTTNYYPDVIWEISVTEDGLYDIYMNYKALYGNILDYVYLDGRVIATSGSFTGYTGDYVDAKLSTAYLTAGKHIVKMTEATDAGGFLFKELKLIPSFENIPTVVDGEVLRVENENEVYGKLDITNQTLTKRVIVNKKGLYTLALAWASWTGGKADIIVNGQTIYSAVEPSKVFSDGGDYIYASYYLKDYYSIPLDTGVNEVSIKATSYIYFDHMEFSNPVAAVPGSYTEICTQPNFEKKFFDLNASALSAKVNVEKTGEYNLVLNWSGYDGTDTATITVNDVSLGSYIPTQQDTSNYAKPEFFKEDTYKINLNAGENTITVKADSGKWVYIDKLTVICTGLGFSKVTLKSADVSTVYANLEEAKNAGNTVCVATDAVNTSGTEESFTLVVASYDENSNLIAVRPFAPETVAAGETKTLKSAELGIEGASIIKLFALDNLDDITPLYTFEDIK